MAVERKPGPLTGHSIGMVRVRDTVAEDAQTRKRIVMHTIIEILVSQTVDGVEELVWVDISKVVKRVVTIMEVGAAARVTIDLFGTATEIDRRRSVLALSRRCALS